MAVSTSSLRPSGPPAPGARNPGAPASPAARRLQPPRWRDGRLLAGILLLLLSVVVGARVLSTGQSTAPVLAVATTLPAGHVLAAGDLRTEQVRLPGGPAADYLPGSSAAGLVGRVLTRPLSRDELLPAGAIGGRDTSARRVVPVKVRDGRMPRVTAGDLVDVYATTTARAGAGATPAAGSTGGCATTLVVAGAEVAEDADPAGGGDVTLLLRVPDAQAAQLVLASEATSVDISRHIGADTPSQSGGTPAAPPATGADAVGGLPVGACAQGSG